MHQLQSSNNYTSTLPSREYICRAIYSWSVGQAEVIVAVRSYDVMMADNQLNNVDGDDIFVYTGGEQRVPRDVERVRIAENVDTILAETFAMCRELRELVGHNKLKKIERSAFYWCTSLRTVTKMTGLIEIEDWAFNSCVALSDIDFDKLEIIGEGAFIDCESLRSISMPSIRRIGQNAFNFCGLTDVMFGQGLEGIEMQEFAFADCTSLRLIVIPLKDNLILDEYAFSNCENFSRVDTLAEEIHTTISSLHMETWRKEMQEEIDNINQTLPNTGSDEKAGAIEQWITRVLGRIEHYKTEHKMLVKEAMTLLELALWKANLRENEDDDPSAQEGVRVTRGQRKRKRNDRCITSGASIVIKNVLPFLALE